MGLALTRRTGGLALTRRTRGEGGGANEARSGEGGVGGAHTRRCIHKAVHTQGGL